MAHAEYTKATEKTKAKATEKTREHENKQEDHLVSIKDFP